MTTIIDGITYVSVARTEYVLNCALVESGYQAGDAFSFSFTMEEIASVNDSYPLLKLAENYYLIAQKNNYLGLSYQKGHMMDNGDAAGGGKSLWEESTLIDGVNEYEKSDGLLYSWISRDSSGINTSTDISKSVVTVSTDGTDSVIEVYCPNDGRRSRITLKNTVLNLYDFSFVEESQEEETGSVHGRIENVSGSVTLNGVEYSLFTNEFALKWAGTEENHEWNTDESNTIWVSEANGEASYMPGDEVYFEDSGYRTVTINSDVQARIITVMSDITFDMADGLSLAASNRLEVVEGATLTLATQGQVSLDVSIDGPGSVIFSEGTWLLNQSLADGASIKVADGVNLHLAEGVVLNLDDTTLGSFGSITAEGAQSGMVSSAAGYEFSVMEGQSIILTNGSGLRLSGEGTWLGVYEGGLLQMEGGTLETGTLESAGTVTLSGTTLVGDIVNHSSLSMTDCRCSGYISAEAGSETVLDDVTCAFMFVSDDHSVSVGEKGLTLTDEDGLYLYDFSGNTAILFSSLGNLSTAEDAYVVISGESIGSAILVSSSAFPQGYVLDASAEPILLPTGGYLILEQGAVLNPNGNTLVVEGSLNVAFETETVAIESPADGSVLWVNGGSINLAQASVNLSGASSGVLVESGSFTMTGGSYTADVLDIYDSATLNGTAVDAGVYCDGSLTMTDVTSSSFIDAAAGSSVSLDGVSCASLYVSDDSSVTVSGDGLTLTEQSALYLEDFTGSIDTLVQNLGSVTTVQSAYIVLSSEVEEGPAQIGVSELKTYEAFAGGYVLQESSSFTLASGKELVLDASCRLDLNGSALSIAGRLEARESAVITDPTGLSNLSVEGGSFYLRGSSIDLSGDSSRCSVSSSALLDMTGGKLHAGIINLDASSNAALRSVEIEGAMLNYGTLILSGGTFTTGGLAVMSGAELYLADTVLPELVVQSQVSGELYNSSGLRKLTLSMGAELDIKGNDFTGLESFTLTDVADGQYIELGDNNWGTEDKAEIFASLGEYAQYVTLGGTTSAQVEASRFYVNNLNTSGEGSLTAAIIAVNAYTGDATPSIFIDESIAASSLNLTSSRVITRSCRIVGHGFTITGSGLSSSAALDISDLTLSRVELSGAGSLSAQLLTLTGQEAIRLSNWNGSIDFSGITTTSEGAYVGVSSLATCTLRAIPEGKLSGGYRSYSDVEVQSGATVTLEEGVCLTMQDDHEMFVFGTLVAEYEEEAIAIAGTALTNYVYIYDGGKLQLKNASVEGVREILVYTGGTLEMTGGMLETRYNRVEIHSGATATLNGVTVKDVIHVVDGATVTGSDNTFTRLETFLLGSYHNLYFTGDTAGLLAAIGSAAEGAYISVHNLGTCTLAADTEGKLSGGYRSYSDVKVQSGATVTLEEGVCLTMQDEHCLYVKGTLVAEYAEEAVAIAGTAMSGYVSIDDGGKLQLKNASVEGVSKILVYTGGTMEMTGGMLETLNEVEIRSGATASLNGVTVKDVINVVDGATVTGSDNTFTRLQTFQLGGYNSYFTGGTAGLLAAIGSAAEGAYIGVYNLGTCTLAADTEGKLSGGYRSYSYDVEVQSGATVTLEEGVCLTMQDGHALSVYGSLVAEYEEEAIAIAGTGDSAELLIRDNGQVQLQNASVEGVSNIRVHQQSTLVMTGGKLDSRGVIEIHTGASVTLNGVTVNDVICIYNAASVNGHDNIFTGTELYRLNGGFVGSTANLLNSIGSAAEGAYISVDNLGTCTLSADTEGKLSGGYRSYSDVEVQNGATVTLEEGVCLTMQDDHDLFVFGTLVAEYEEEAIAIAGTASSDYVYINGGKLQLKNASVEGMRVIVVYTGGTLEMTGGMLETRVVEIRPGATVTLTGVTVKDTIQAHGTLTLQDCRLDANKVLVYEGGASTIQNTSGIGKLTVYVSSAAQVITGNDFSGTTVELLDLEAGEVIDLSGNYWGTNDRDEIIAKISGYQEGQVILNDWIVGLPEQEFEAESLVGDTLASAGTRTMTVKFSHVLDETTLAENVRLVNLMGEEVSITSFSQQNGELTLHFEALPSDGLYSVVLGAGLKNEYGKSLALPEGAEDVRLDFQADVTTEFVTEIRVPESTTAGYIDVMLSGEISAATLSSEGWTLLAPDGGEVKVTGCEMLPGVNGIRVYVEELPAMGSYSLTLPETLTDAAGNAVQGSEVRFNVASPDAVVTAAATAYEATTTGKVTVEASFTNQGNGNLENGRVEIWLTKEGSLTTDAVLMYTYELGSVSVGSGTTVNLQAELDLSQVPDMLAGEYKLVARVQDDNEVPELRGDNTAVIGNLTVSYPPAADLSVQVGDIPQQVQPGETLTIPYVLRHAGPVAAESVGKLYFGMIPAGGDVADMVQLGMLDMSSLSLVNGAVVDMPMEVSIPADIRLDGEVQFVVLLQTNIYEQPGTTANNVAVSGVVQLGKTLSITSSVDTITEGRNARVVYTIARSGDCSQALTVRLSSDQAERLGLPESVTIAAGQSSARVQATVVNDAVYTGNVSTTVVADAAGYTTSSTGITILEDEKPTISLQLEPAAVSEGADAVVRGVVSIDTVFATDTVIKLGSTYASQLQLPESVTIKAGESSVSFEAPLVEDAVAEIDKEVKISAAAAGFNGASATVKVQDDDIPQVELVLSRDIVSETDGYYAITATLVRKGGSNEAITVKLQDVDGVGLILPSSIPVAAGVQNVKFTIGVVDDALANGERSGTIRGTIIIADCGCDASTSSNGGMFETTVTVQDNDSPALTVSLNRTVLREGGSEVAVLTVKSNHVSDSDVVVRLGDGGLLNLPESIIIKAGSTSASCNLTAKAGSVESGTQYTTITAEAEGYITGRGYMQVTDVDIPDLVVDSITLDESAIAGRKTGVTVVIRNQGYAPTAEASVVEIRLSDGTVLGSVTVGKGLAAGESLTLGTEVNLPEMTGRYSLLAEANKTGTVSELDMTNNTKVSSSFIIGSGYTVRGAIAQDVLYKAGSINITGGITPTVEGLPLGGQTVMVYLYRDGALMHRTRVTTAEDGSFALDYTVPAGLAGRFTLKAGVLTEMSETLDTVDVAGLALGTSSGSLKWLIEKGNSTSGIITVRNTGSVDLHNVQLLIDSLPSNLSFVLENDTLAVLAAGSSASFHYTITGNELSVGDLYSLVDLQVVSDEGLALDVNGYSYVMTPKADIELSTRSLNATVNHENQRYVELVIRNVGGGDTGRVNVSLPGIDWLSVYSGGDIENIASGESATVVFKVDPTTADIILNAPYTGSIVVNSENGGSERMNFNVTFVDADKCRLTVNTIDSYSLQFAEKTIISGARVRIYNAYTNQLVKSALTDADGVVSFEEMEAGAYYMYVDADNCDRFKTNFTLVGGEDSSIDAYLTSTTLEYTFTVTPSEIEDKYEITQTVDFTTNVPTPVVVFETSSIQIPDIRYGETVLFNIVVRNYGLVAAQQYSLTIPDADGLSFEIHNPVDTIAANDSHEFIVRVTADAPPIGMNAADYVCYRELIKQTWLSCAADGTLQVNYATLLTNQEYCQTTTTPGNTLPPNYSYSGGGGYGGGGGGSVPVYGGGGGGGGGTGSVSTPIKYETVVDACTPCRAAILNMAAQGVSINRLTLGSVLSYASTFLAESANSAMSWARGSYTVGSLNEVMEQVPAMLTGGIARLVEKYNAHVHWLLESRTLIVNCLDNEAAGSPALTWLGSAKALVESGLVEARAAIKAALMMTTPFESVVEAYLDKVESTSSVEGRNALLKAYSDFMAMLEENAFVRSGEELTPQSMGAEARQQLVGSEFAALAGADVVEALITKWNRTVDYAARGITSVAGVPAGQSTDFFSAEELEQIYAAVDDTLDNIVNLGHGNLDSHLGALINQYNDNLGEGGDDVCATVKLQFTQTAAMTREAFEGVMTLSNGTSMGDLKDVSFSVYVVDANGVDVTEHFLLHYYDITGFTGISAEQSGNGITGATLPTGKDAEVRIQYIPDRTLAAEGSAEYRFGAQLTYTHPSTGEETVLNMTPVTLTINPSPSLDLHYFLTEDVYSDDPYTDKIEAAQKTEIGFIVKNNGLGEAKNFTMSDFHPEFLSNEMGLDLELKMLGSSLNGGALQQSGTTLQFGNIGAHSTSTAIWYFQTNMHGYFSNYEASFTRIDSMGDTAFVSTGTDVSLIESVNTHMLTRSMNADGDEKTDFLVNDVRGEADPYDLADGIYFGDGSYEAVNGVVNVMSTTGALENGNNTITLSMYASAGWNYFRINDPGAGKYRLLSVSVGGQELDASMFWQTDRVFAADGVASYVNRMHWVYEAAQDGLVDFVITYDPTDKTAPEVLEISGVEKQSTVREALETLTVVFDEAVNRDSFSLANVKLELENEALDLTGLTWEWVNDTTLRFTNIARFTAEDGAYLFTVLNNGVKDVYGNSGDGSGDDLMWTKATRKVGVALVNGYTDRKLNTRVHDLMVSFTEAVGTFTLDAIKLEHISADGVITVITDLSQLEIERLNEKEFLIVNLEKLQSAGDGSYRVSIDSTKVKAANGASGVGMTPVVWALYETPATVLRSSFVENEQLHHKINTILLHFSHGVSSLDISKLTLVRSGVRYAVDSLNYEIDPEDASVVRISGLLNASPMMRSLPVTDGEWTLGVDLSGVEDIYGNTGSGIYNADWTVDTVAPEALEGITVNGRETLVVAGTNVEIGINLPESGLQVSIYESGAVAGTQETLLWSGTVEGTTLNQAVTLLGGGTRTISIVTADAAGNSTTNTYNVLVDMVVLSAETDLQDRYKELPESIVITFNAGIEGLPLSALSLAVNGNAVSLAGALITRISDTEWSLSGFARPDATIGSYSFTVDYSQLTKSLSGLSGQGSYTQEFTYDPITEVRIIDCDLTAGVEQVTSLSISFSTAINYTALQEAGLLSSAVRLVNQADGSVVLLDAAGFTYADKVLSWSGEQELAGGSYALVVDPALLTAANGSPLVSNSGTADTAIVSYEGDAVLLGAGGAEYSAPYATDWNGDGFADLLVGEKDGSAGKVRLYLNNGSGAFTNFSYLQSNGADLSVSASGCQGVVVALQDITGDGLADLVAGLSSGAVQYFAGMANGSFGSAVELVSSSVAGSRAYPTFYDWNADGVADLVLGTGSGSLMVGLGSKDAATGALSFATPTVVAGIEVPGRAAPVFTDVNGDSVADLILGAGDGSLTLYYGSGSGSYYKTGSWLLEGINWSRSRVTVADLNADGTSDLIVGGSTGEIYVVYGEAPANSWTQAVEIKAAPSIIGTTTEVNAASVILSWSALNATSATRYVVEVADNADFADATVYGGLETTTLTLDSHAEGAYFWRVSIEGSAKPAVNGTGYTVDTIAPGAPDSLVSSAVGNTAVLTWAAQTDASGVKYEVRCSATEDFSSATVITTTEPRLNVSGLPAGEWYWQVRAVDGAGNASAWSTAADAFNIDEVITPDAATEHHWAQGLVTSGATLVSGYWDADKSGTGDTQLTWAAADANMLAWWQRQYGVTDFSSSDVPESADDIFAAFRQNWANVSGREEYGLTWWISGASENGSYGTYYADNYTGSGEQGAYYAPHYDAAATSALVKEVSLTGADAEQLARDWTAVFADGGIISLGVYSSVSGSTLVGGHALTVWGFATDAAGRLSSITVTDSDDGVDAAVTLSLAYNVTKGYYQIAQSGSSLNGRLLGDYTSLAAFDKQDAENNTATGAGTITMTEPENGASMSTAARFDWVGTGDAADFYEFTAPGVGIYRVNVNTRELDSDLLISVGSLDSNGDFVVERQAQIKPNASISGISGLRLDGGEQQYIRISAAEGGATSYELMVRGDIDEASPITDNNVKQKATKVVGTIQEDATISSWVGSGDALDLYYFELTEECNFSLNLGGLDKNAKVKLYYDNGDGSYGSIISNTVRASRGLEFNDALAAGTYYLEIASYDKGAGRYNTAYTLELEKETDGVTTRLSLESDSPLTDNNTKETATELELVSVSDAVITSWVGAGDALDYYRFEVSQAGTLGICLSELEKNTTLRLYQGTEDGYNLTMSSTVRASRGLDTELDLAVGTYYLEIASYDNGAGRFNTTYALELEKEEDGEIKRYAIAGEGLA